MIIIFEDDREDLIQQLFRLSYNSNINEKFVYAQGNGKIKDEIEKYIKSCSDNICIYLDLVMDNPDTVKLFNEIKKYSKTNRVMTIPIFCSEYCLLKSIQNMNHLCKDNNEINECLMLKPYYNSKLLSDDKSKKYIRTFERYCKQVLNRCTLNCLDTSSKHYDENENEIINNRYKLYYTEDCICNMSTNKCIVQDLKIKSLSLLSSYPCIPSGVNLIDSFNIRVTDKKSIYRIHCEQVNKYNQAVNEYMAEAAIHGRKCKYISPYRDWSV